MNCPNCGIETPGNQKYCRSCGMNLEHIARAVKQYIAESSDHTLSENRREHIGKLLGVSGTALIFLLLIGFFIDLALLRVTGVGLSEAVFDKIAIPVMAIALPLLLGGFGLIVGPAIYRELFKGRSHKQSQLNPETSALELPPAGQLRIAGSVTEHTTAELQPPERRQS